MSDEPIRPGAPATTPAGIWVHLCERDGCSKWGGWGYSRFKDAPVRWYCYEHRGEGERLIGRG